MARRTAAKLAEQRAKLAAGEPIRCACCFDPIESPDDAVEKHGSLVHAGDCEQQWGSANDESERPRRGAERMIRPPDLLTSITSETQMHHSTHNGSRC